MILVQFKDRFRERLPEWITSFALVGWGLIVLSETPDLWSREYFHVLANIAPQYMWGFATIMIGIARLLSLFVNGAWRPTAHFRAMGAFAGCLIWGSIMISYATLTWSPPAIAVKAAMLAFDLFALWFAAGDAKMADIRAKRVTV